MTPDQQDPGESLTVDRHDEEKRVWTIWKWKTGESGVIGPDTTPPDGTPAGQEWLDASKVEVMPLSDHYAVLSEIVADLDYGQHQAKRRGDNRGAWALSEAARVVRSRIPSQHSDDEERTTER